MTTSDFFDAGEWVKEIGEEPANPANVANQTSAFPHVSNFSRISAGGPAILKKINSRQTQVNQREQLICCIDCESFEKDKIGSGDGIGKCRCDAWKPLVLNGRVNPWGPLYPYVKRVCEQFKPLQNAEKM